MPRILETSDTTNGIVLVRGAARGVFLLEGISISSCVYICTSIGEPNHALMCSKKIGNCEFSATCNPISNSAVSQCFDASSDLFSQNVPLESTFGCHCDVRCYFDVTFRML